LIDNKVDCNKISNAGYTPLAYTVSTQFHQGTELLLHAGARVNKKGIQGRNRPLFYAETNIATVKMLLAHGALAAHDILHYAIKRKNTLQSIVNQLQTAYKNQNETNKTNTIGQTITHFDILRYSTLHIKSLLKTKRLVTDEILQYAITRNSDMQSIVDLLEAAYKEQSCCICYYNQQEIQELWNCNLNDIPCKTIHPHSFICEHCYDLLALNTEKEKPCPQCRQKLNKYGDT
jgi:hypothetical protein